MRTAPSVSDLGRRGGYPVWGLDHGPYRLRFSGRHDGGRTARRDAVLAAVLAGDATGVVAAAPPVAAAHQVHSNTVLLADGPGTCGDGDALITRSPGLALSVVTADCVPVLLAAGEQIAAVHAGWRGIAGGVVAATLERLAAAGAGEPDGWLAWIGPAVASCCYEVGPEVAEAVAAASSPEAVITDFGGCSGDGERPRLDLVAAVRHQLVAGGVGRVSWQVSCTACDSARLYSYRRDGSAAGRNHAFIWRLA